MKRLFVLGMTAFFLVSCGGGQAGKVTAEEFEQKKNQLAEQPYTSGNGEGRVYQKQQGYTVMESQCSYLFTYSEGQWSGKVTKTEGDSYGEKFKTFYAQNMLNYLSVLDALMEVMQNPTPTYTATENEYSATLNGKFDYGKAYPNRGIEGLLAQKFTIKWDTYGMPLSWEFKLSGKLKYQGQTISYEEYALITATWTK